MKTLFLTIFSQIYCALLLFSEAKIPLSEKSVITAKLLFIFTPIGYVLKQLDHWFADNHKFVSFMIYVITINMIVGLYYHWKKHSFSWKRFLLKNSEMFGVMILVYFLLEIINQVAGLSITGEYFQMLIQLVTLLYPISKALKNIHILSNFKHPPSFIMKKLYKFEKTGNVNVLFNNNEQKNDSQNNKQ